MTLKAVAAVCAFGVPVLPVAVPGDAVSPGASSCSLVNGPAVTVVDGLVFGVFVPDVTFDAVIVDEPTVFNVTLKVFVPATIAALAGSVALASVEVMPTVSCC